LQHRLFIWDVCTVLFYLLNLELSKELLDAHDILYNLLSCDTAGFCDTAGVCSNLFLPMLFSFPAHFMKPLDKLVFDTYSLSDLWLKVVELKPLYLVTRKDCRSLPLKVLSQTLHGSLVDVLEESVTLLGVLALVLVQQVHNKVWELLIVSCTLQVLPRALIFGLVQPPPYLELLNNWPAFK